jgi:hypothetical protein
VEVFSAAPLASNKHKYRWRLVLPTMLIKSSANYSGNWWFSFPERSPKLLAGCPGAMLFCVQSGRLKTVCQEFTVIMYRNIYKFSK